MRDGRLKRHPVAYQTFAEAQEAFKRHTGVDWMEAFTSYESYGGFYPGEIADGPTRGSKILPAYFRTSSSSEEPQAEPA
jgi:hypothetical protein